MTGVLVRVCEQTDEAELLALHRRGYADGRTAEHWRWRFLENPLGRHAVTGAFDAHGRCVVAYCGAPLRFSYAGDEQVAISAGDVVIDPGLRHGLAGGRLLRRAIQLHSDTFGGGATRLAYGYPEPGVRRLVARHLRAVVLWDVALLVRDRTAPPLSAPADVHTRTVDRWSDDVDELWGRCRGDHTGLVRDRAYLAWRFERHPRVRYTLCEARDRRDGTLRGLAALREGGVHPDVLALSEWLAPGADVDAERSLLAHAHETLLRGDRQHLVAWFSPPCEQTLRLQRDHAFREHVTAWQVAFRSFARGLDRAWLCERWRQTLGDVDFF